MSFDLRTPWSPQAAESLLMPPMIDTAEAVPDQPSNRPATTAAIATEAAARVASSSEPIGNPPEGWEASEAVVGRVHIVFRCRPADSKADAPFAYALKQVRPEHREDPIVRRLLARGAMLGQLVRSPHLVPVLSARIIGAQPYLVMPWLSGRTLEQRLRLGQSFSTAEALWIARQAACGLGALAERGFVHNDVKPSNLMISDDGHVTVLDLGFAASIGPREHSPSATSVLLGTPAYWPAERTAGAEECSAIDHRSDIFSLGLILAELLLSGNHAIDQRTCNGAERAEELLRRLRATIGLPRELLGLIAQMLARHPWRRPDSYPELIQRLTALEIATFTCRGW